MRESAKILRFSGVNKIPGIISGCSSLPPAFQGCSDRPQDKFLFINRFLRFKTLKIYCCTTYEHNFNSILDLKV